MPREKKTARNCWINSRLKCPGYGEVGMEWPPGQRRHSMI